MAPPIFENLLDDQWFNDLMTQAKTTIDTAYEKNKDIYDTILDFLKANNYIISNQDLVVNKPIAYDKPLQTYVLDPLLVATNILKQLCTKFGKKFVLRTEIKDTYYAIDCQLKTCIKISKIIQYKEVSLVNFLKIESIHGLQVLPPILEIIDIYGKLYNPEYAGDWEDMMANANAIEKITINNIKKTIGGKGASNSVSLSSNALQPNDATHPNGTKRPDPTKEQCDDCKTSRKNIIRDLRELVKDLFKKYKDYVIVNETDLRIISQNDIQVDFERINNYCSASMGTTIYIYFKHKHLFLAKDMRIQRVTLYARISDDTWNTVDKPFLDIYNNGTYELIPYELRNGMKYAHPRVLKRFYFINIWNTLAARNLELIDNGPYLKCIKEQVAGVEKINGVATAPKLYMGVYINEHQYYKGLMLAEKNNTKIYCP